MRSCRYTLTGTADAAAWAGPTGRINAAALADALRCADADAAETLYAPFPRAPWLRGVP